MTGLLMKNLMVAIVLSLFGATTAQAQTPETALIKLLSEPLRTQDFAPAFLQAVPEETLRQVVDQVAGAVGPIENVVETNDGYLISGQNARVTAKIGFDGDGRIATLFFNPPIPNGVTLDQATKALADLGPEVSWLVIKNDKILSEQDADTPMAVGSAFKLGVAAVVFDEIAAGKRDWADVIRLEARHKSLPSGRLQDLPNGSPLTLHTVTAQMISESDNTATDLLIDLLGRDRVMERLGVDTLLTTREFFALKSDRDARTEYLKAGHKKKTAIAEQAAIAAPRLSALDMAFHDGIEWYVPLSTLCRLAISMADQPIMAINPGVTNPLSWASVAYKGGSETDVLNMTTSVTSKTGDRYCAALTVNGSHNADQVFAAYNTLMSVLADDTPR